MYQQKLQIWYALLDPDLDAGSHTKKNVSKEQMRERRLWVEAGDDHYEYLL
jgi:hypothetical protein